MQEARAFQRLIDEGGLTRKGVAERLSIAQKRVTERLQILQLPEQLHRGIASGENIRSPCARHTRAAFPETAT